MRISALIVAAAFVIGVAHASPPCQALVDKVTKGLDSAHKMSDSDKTAKCRALSLVDYDLMDVAHVCLAPDDKKIIEQSVKPLAKSLAGEMEQACRG